VVEDHAGAINYDLMKMGLRLRMLGTEALSWGDLHDYVRYGNTDTALALERHGATVLWGITDHLLAVVADALHAANWQRGGGKGMRPQPIQRPGVEDGSQKLGADPIPAADFMDWWNDTEG
jgi:hypothetical protein